MGREPYCSKGRTNNAGAGNEGLIGVFHTHKQRGNKEGRRRVCIYPMKIGKDVRTPKWHHLIHEMGELTEAKIARNTETSGGILSGLRVESQSKYGKGYRTEPQETHAGGMDHDWFYGRDHVCILQLGKDAARRDTRMPIIQVHGPKNTTAKLKFKIRTEDTDILLRNVSYDPRM